MKRKVQPFCILSSALGIAVVFYLFGLSAKSFAVAAIFLVCPVWTLIQTTRIVRQYDKDVAEIRLKLQRRNQP